MSHVDIAIVGGGLVGSSAACALAPLGLSIALIDATSFNATDHKLLALNHYSCDLLEKILGDKLWDTAAAIKQVHVSDRGHFGKLRLHAKDVELESLGYVIPALKVNTALEKVLTTFSNVTVLRPETLQSLDKQGDNIALQLSSQQISARYVIGADGNHSTVRKALGIETTTHDYQHRALVTVTQLQRYHDNIAYERFHGTGAIAMLPLDERACATIWTDQSAIIENLLALTDKQFCETLQRQFGYRLGRFANTRERFSYPLIGQQVKSKFSDNVLLIGNAAHALHPIAAQGFNLALAEVGELSKLFAEKDNVDFQPFIDWQQQREQMSLRYSDKLPGLFFSDFMVMKFLRQWGMIGIDNLPFLKKRFTQSAMFH